MPKKQGHFSAQSEPQPEAFASVIARRRFTQLLSERKTVANLGKALTRATKAFVGAMGPGQYSAGGKKVVCPQCEGDTFAEGSALLNTAGMTFMNLDWANKSAVTLACTECGRILWFMKRPDRL